MVDLYDKDGILRVTIPDVETIEELENIIKNDHWNENIVEIARHFLPRISPHVINNNLYVDEFPKNYKNKCENAFCACTGACRGLNTQKVFMG